MNTHKCAYTWLCIDISAQKKNIMVYLTSFSKWINTPPSSAPNAQPCSHHPPMLPMYNHAVTTLPCSQCTIMQSPPSHAPNAQSCSHHPPMSCVTSTYTVSYVSPVLSYNLIYAVSTVSHTSWTASLGQSCISSLSLALSSL